MSDHAFSFYCHDEYWRRCNDEDLEIVEILEEDHDADGSLKRKDAIHRCRKCGGFYRQLYRATYYPSHLFDTEEGWSITNDYFRIDQPRWTILNSTLDVPFPLSDARRYGYAGEDHSWKNGRCNFPAQNVELTCRAADLQFVAYHTHEAWDHLRDRFYKCRRCGQWYFFKILPPYTEALLKPSNELFPLDAARFQGYKTEQNSDSTEPAVIKPAAPGQTVVTLQLIVQEALVLTPEFVRETPYKVNFFCRVPADWIENNRLKPEFWKKIADQIFGEDWSAETFPIGHYIIKSSETVIFDDREVKDRKWRDFVETDDNLYYFFIGSENGEAEKVTAPKFQEETDAHFRNAAAGSSNLQPETENLHELDASLADAWQEPEKLPAASEWLKSERSEAAQAQYAYIVLKKHFARENFELRKEELPISWWSMGWALYLNVDALMREQKRTEMLKAMFVELVDFCEAASGEYFAYRLKELLETLDDSRQSRAKLTPLLPAKALAQFAEIDRMLDEEHEAYLDRINQMGY